MEIEQNMNVILNLKVHCKRCDIEMNNTGNLTKSHLYFNCPKCKAVIVINLDIKREIKS